MAASSSSQARAAVNEQFPELEVSISSEVFGQWREYERTSTCVIDAFLKPIRERRAEFATKPATVREIIMEGTRKGRAVAQSTMDEVRAAMKLNYNLG